MSYLAGAAAVAAVLRLTSMLLYAVANEGAAASAMPAALPTSGTSDPAVLLASISPAAAPVQQAVILPFPTTLPGAVTATDVPLTVETSVGTASPTIVDDPAVDPTTATATAAPAAELTALEATQEPTPQTAADAAGIITVQAVTSTFSGLLSQHNTYRATHRAPALQWDDTLAAGLASTVGSFCTDDNLAKSGGGMNAYRGRKVTQGTAIGAATLDW